MLAHEAGASEKETTQALAIFNLLNGQVDEVTLNKTGLLDNLTDE
jgi:hypothetical protein